MSGTNPNTLPLFKKTPTCETEHTDIDSRVDKYENLETVPISC